LFILGRWSDPLGMGFVILILWKPTWIVGSSGRYYSPQYTRIKKKN
jgi:hypothetical protein